MTLPFYPFYWGDYSSKTFDLTQGQHGAYMLFLRYVYCTGKHIPHNERYSIAKATLSENTIERENADFILTKYFRKKNGSWYNVRADEILSEQSNRHQALVAAGKRGGRPRKATVKPPFLPEKASPKQPEPEPEPIEEEGTDVPSSAPPLDALDAPTIKAVTTAWNNLASETGLAQVQHLNEGRRKALKRCLKEIGGLEGWYAMCDKIRGSPFLTGRGEKPWYCTFDWVLNQKNLTKIMEGNYDDRQHGNGKDRHDQGTNFTRAAKKVSDAIDRRIAEAEAAERGERGGH